MPFATSMYIVGPVIAFAVIGTLGVVLRWTFNSSELRRTEAEIFATTPDDYGLLKPAGIVGTEADGRLVAALLSDAGIRATVARGRDGRIRVLVFGHELEAARRLVGGSAL